MKFLLRHLIIIFIQTVLLATAYSQENSNSIQINTGPYLGLANPGDKPQLFKPNLSQDIEIMSIPLFYRNGNLLVFKGTYSSVEGVFLTENKNGAWTEPELILTLSQYDDRHFFMTLDEKRIYFTSLRPVREGDGQSENPNIWVIEKSTSGWFEPNVFDESANPKEGKFYSTLSKNNTLYYTAHNSESGLCDIVFTKYINGKFGKMINPGIPVNTEHIDGDPYIAPDESYMIFLSDRPGGLGQHDFYITFRDENSKWTEPIHLGKEINSEKNDVCPLVTPDGKYFFFGSNSSGKYKTYWMDAGFIEKLRKNYLK
ncbi:hypothetical protein ACFL6G_07785 [candidate division KSB1 bacterium]